MKILHVVRQFSPAIGGMELFVENLMEAQLKIGYQTDVLTLNRVFYDKEVTLSSKECRQNYNIFRIPFVGSKKYPIAIEALHYFDEYDLIHVHGVDFFIDFIASLKFVHKKKIVLSTHGGYFHTNFAKTLKSVFFNTVTRMTLKSVDAVIADSQPDYDIFSRIYRDIKLIENGVDTKFYSNNDNNRKEDYLLFVGRLATNKRVDLLLETLVIVKEHIPEVKLVIVGPDDSNLFGSYHNIIEKNGLWNNVQFLGEVSKEKLREVVQKAKIFVSASSYEGFGISLIESMAAGTVPVVQNNDSFRWLLKNVNSNFLVDFSEQQGKVAAQKIIYFMGLGIEKYSKLSECCAEESMKYAWSNKVLEYDSVYRDVLEKNE
jgi:alpha-1,3-mannosyltransferase